MPLPTSDTNLIWPPANLTPILTAMGQWDAWVTNSLERLQIAYGGGTTGDTTGFFASDTGGRKVHSLGPIRWFVGQATQTAERNTKLPIPIAAEMCQASADLLFSDPMTVTVTDTTTQARIDELLDDYFHTTQAEAAESCAGLGGVYLRATWDVDAFPDGPFSTGVDADTAIPEFKWGRLNAVTFWAVVSTVGKLVYRHLERHELAPNGNGVILHGLYEGEVDKLGTRVSLTTLPETAAMAIHVDLNVEGTIDTLSEGLAVEYVPNQTPNRMWRKHPIGRNLGRSDLDGVEHLLDQLAETMSDWMRARRVARARILASKELTKSLGPGNGSVVNLDQEVYTTVSGGGGTGGLDSKLGDQVQLLQPVFDPTGYKVTATELMEQIFQMAGYSAQTFGMNPEGSPRTATEIESRERRSLTTRARKLREWTPAERRHVTKLLAIDRDFFGHPNNMAGLAVEFADGVQESQINLGLFVQSLYTSESASVEERVSILHKDWSEEQISEEVELIKAEFAMGLPNPMMTPFDGAPNDGSATA